MSKLTDQINSDDVDVVRAVARELMKDISALQAALEKERSRVGMTVEAVQSQRQEHELERAMWKDIVALLRRSLEIAEQDVAYTQQTLATAAATVKIHLPFWLNWIWTRSSADEIVNHRGTRDALHQLVGLMLPFAQDVGE